jgi:hypothetical protein
VAKGVAHCSVVSDNSLSLVLEAVPVNRADDVVTVARKVLASATEAVERSRLKSVHRAVKVNLDDL